MTSVPEIAMMHVDKRYGERPLLQDFTMEIQPGQFVTCIGSSGSGKTTVLKLMNGLLAPDSGQVYFRGEDIARLNQNRLRRRIGYCIQGTGLFPHLTVGQNIAYVPHLEKADEAALRFRVEELAGVVRLEASLLARYPHELSGGQRQRVGIARALAAKPSLLLMDEPFGAVDDITRKSLRREIRRIHAEIGLTIFFITHDIDEALALGTRVVVLHKGRLEQDGSPECVASNPETAFVQKLIRANSRRYFTLADAPS